VSATQASERGAFRASLYPYLVLGVLLVVYVLNYLDRQLVSILAEPIKADLGLSDTQLGLVTGFMFALFYTTFGVPVAWLADRARRTTIVAVACGLWSLFTGACGLAGNFVHLMLARIGVGVGEAGGVPPSYTILADYFPPRRRGLAMGLYALGIPLGTFLGGAYGAWAAGRFGWRGAFLTLAIPGILAAMALPFLVREPVRGGLDTGDDAKAPAVPLLTAIGLYVKSATLVLATLGCSLSAVVGYSLQSWSPAFLMRVQGASLHDVGAVYSPVIAICVAAGIFGSGWLVDRLGARSQRAYPLVPAAAFVLAFPLYIAAISVHDWRWSVALMAIPQGLTFTYLAPAVAVVQNLTPPSRRSTASAMLLFVLNLLAVGCGPLYVGAVSDWAKPTYGVESLRIALFALIPFFILGVGCNYAASVAMKRRGAG
jgi:MFS family permease